MNIDNCRITPTQKNIEKKIFFNTIYWGKVAITHLRENGYFRYNSKSKLWEAVLK